MPTYEYACSSCDATHEVQQKMTDAALTTCPVCGQSGLRKVFSGVGIHFKGSGFYRTDSRDAKSSGSGEKGTGDKGSSSDKGSSDKGSSGDKTSSDKGSKEASPKSAPASTPAAAST